MNKNKNKKKGEARRPSSSIVFDMRRKMLAMGSTLDQTIKALRHSNAVAAYMLELLDGPLRIAKADYQKLLDDDATTVKIDYEGDEVVVSMPVPPNVNYTPAEKRTLAAMAVASASPEDRTKVKNKVFGDLYGATPTLTTPTLPRTTHVEEGPRWECPSCKTVNIPGNLMLCDTCGAQRPMLPEAATK